MIPLRLQFEGFARFNEPQLISFEDLELFAITGPTGAGKTLILDALSFALYGVTARQSRQVDSLISNDRQRLAVDLQFQAGPGTFRVTRTMERRASGTVSKSARLEQLLDGKWKRVTETEKLTELNARLISILGLDFAAFTRSILLPQGKFDEFLHGEPRQRRELLKELLGLKRVDSMREEAGRRERASAARAESLTARLEADGLNAAPERVRELKAELHTLEHALEDSASRLGSGRLRLKDAEEAALLHAELEQLARELARQQETARQAPELQRELERGRQAAALAPLLSHGRNLQAQLARAEAELAEAAEQLPGLQASLDAAREQADAAAAELNAAEPELNARLEQLQALLPLARWLQRLGGAPEQTVAQPAVFSEEKLEELQQLSARMPALQAAEEREGRARNQLERAATEAATAEQEAERLAAQLAPLLLSGKESAARLEQLRSELARAELHSGEAVHTLRASLAEGGQCPVCGQLVTSVPEHTADSAAPLREQLNQAEQAHLELQEHYRQLEASRREQQLLAGTHRRSEQEQTTELAKANAALNALREQFTAAGLAGSASEMSQSLAEALLQQRSALARQLEAVTAGEEPEARAAQLRKQLSELRAAGRAAETTLTAAERAHARVSEQLKLREQALAGQRQALDAHSFELGRQLQEAGFAAADEVEESMRPAARLQELSELLERTSRELARLEDRQQELSRELQDRPDKRPELEALRSEVAQLEATLQDQRERRGGLQAELRQQQQLVTRLLELTEERRLLEEERSLWRQLALDLQENRFTDFLLQGLQRRLAHHASRIIRQVTGDRFDLHLSDGGEFEVSDSWAGGERRSARSLSGGETFIVSLALALALSDAAGGSRRLGALFLDEGFGTLDADTLDSVAGVLESLSGEGRLVGVITHVSALAERLPARLVVRKDAAGSTVHWED